MKSKLEDYLKDLENGKSKSKGDKPSKNSENLIASKPPSDDGHSSVGWAKETGKGPILDIWGQNDDFDQKAAGINNAQTNLLQQMENTRKMLEQPSTMPSNAGFGQFSPATTNAYYSAGNPFTQNPLPNMVGMDNQFSMNRAVVGDSAKIDPFSMTGAAFNIQQQNNGFAMQQQSGGNDPFKGSTQAFANDPFNAQLNQQQNIGIGDFDSFNQPNNTQQQFMMQNNVGTSQFNPSGILQQNQGGQMNFASQPFLNDQFKPQQQQFAGMSNSAMQSPGFSNTGSQQNYMNQGAGGMKFNPSPLQQSSDPFQFGAMKAQLPSNNLYFIF